MHRILAILIVCVPLLGLAAAHAAEPSLHDYFTRAEIDRAREYRDTRALLGYSALGLSIVTLGLLGLGRGSRMLGAWSARVARARWWLQAALLTAVVVVVPLLVTLPFSSLRHRHDRAFGLATNSLAEHLADVAKATGFQLGISIVAALGFVAIARRLRRAWPAVVAALGAILIVAMVYLFPVVYEPIFNRFDPVDEQTEQRILTLADRAGVEVRDVLVADASRRTTRQNAYVSGIGGTRRVVLWDTLLEGSPPEQVDAVVAHELAHVKHDDVLTGTFIGAGGVVLGVLGLWGLLSLGRLRRWIGIDGPGDPRVVPFLAFAIAAASLVTLPVSNAISRAMEARADRTAVEITGDPETQIELQVSLARDNLSDLTPNRFVVWMFYTHPPVMERIAIALEAAEEQTR